MRWSVDDGDWVILAFDAADGELGLPWTAPDIERVLDLYSRLADLPAPQGLPTAADLLNEVDGWHHAVDDGRDLTSWDSWVGEHLDLLLERSHGLAERAAGTSLVHMDARRDNIVRAGDRLLLVDWPYATRGAPWLDLLTHLPSLATEGGGNPAEIWDRAEVTMGADEEDVTAVLAGLAGFFVCASVQPSPPGIPHLRSFQRAQGEAALSWLRARLAEGL